MISYLIRSIRSTWVLFCPPWSIQFTSGPFVHFGHIQSTRFYFVHSVYFGPKQSTLVLYGPIQSYSFHFGLISSVSFYSVHFALFGLSRSYLVILVLFGLLRYYFLYFRPIQSILVIFGPLWSYLLYFGLIRFYPIRFGHIWSTLRSLIRSCSIHFGPIPSTLVIFCPIGPIWSYSDTSVLFNPFRFIWPYSVILPTLVLLYPLDLIWSRLVLFGLICAIFVHLYNKKRHVQHGWRAHILDPNLLKKIVYIDFK